MKQARGNTTVRRLGITALCFVVAVLSAIIGTSGPVQASALHHVYRTCTTPGGCGLWLRDAPTTTANHLGLMYDGDAFTVNCWAPGPSVYGDPIWLQGSWNGRGGWAMDYYIDTHWSTTQDLTNQGMPPCGSSGGSSGGGSAPSNAVWFGMPFHGTWPNTDGCFQPTSTAASCSLPYVHHTDFGGDFAMDLQSVAPGTPVYLYAAPKYSSLNVTAQVTRVDYACADRNPWHGGYQVQVTLWGNGAEIGHATYAHIWPTVSYGQTISRWGTRLGTVGSYVSNGCWTGAHVHFELYNDVHYACYAPNWHPANWLNLTNYIGYMGGAYAYGQHAACPYGA
jgi:hypothetical protein